MPEAQRRVMQALYDHDIWQDFVASPTTASAEGWNGNHPALKRLAALEGTRTIIDVGVWKGQSTITLAQALKKSRIDGCVIAVDTFLGSAEHWKVGLNTFTRAHIGNRAHGMPDVYQTFMSNVSRAGVQDYVVPMPQTSSTAALILQRLGITATIVHIDAAHEYEDVMRDTAAYWNLLDAGGYLIGDDYHADWPGVVRAAGEFSARVCRPLTIEPPKWILQKN